MAADRTTESAVCGSLRDATIDRLACLFRHWTWADEAMVRFNRELAGGWEYGEDPLADHPFGAYSRIHEAFGEALRHERMSRDLDALDH